MPTAITLRAARPGSATPCEEFVTDLHDRLAAALAPEDTAQPRPAPRPEVNDTRRQLVAPTTAAAAVVDHTVSRGPAQPGPGGQQPTLIPNIGAWRTVDAAARQLDCPCHRTSLALNGKLLQHQLPVPPPALPQFEVREVYGAVQVYAPPGPVV